MVRTPQFFSRHSGVQFFNISTSKSGPELMCFVHFHFKMRFSPRSSNFLPLMRPQMRASQPVSNKSPTSPCPPYSSTNLTPSIQPVQQRRKATSLPLPSLYFYFFLIAGCNGSLGYWQSLATRESNKQHQWYCVPKESQVPIHYDLSHHNLCMTERMVHSEKRDTTTQEEPKQEDTNQQQKPTPTTKQKTIAGTEVRREGETVLTRSVHLLQQIAQ